MSKKVRNKATYTETDGDHGPNVSIRPTKSFFVNMFTRDIELADAILDLLDNCVDGILRSSPEEKLETAKPYSGKKAEIVLSEDNFIISDNCGGIPWAKRKYAFQIGTLPNQEKEKLPTVGTYGIGMKRAIFKLGREAQVSSQREDKSFEVMISPDWMKDESTWDVPIETVPFRGDESGTVIRVKKLNSESRERFGDKSFLFELRERIATHYAFILDKGFSVSVNDELIKPKPTRLRFEESFEKSKTLIRPFIYQDTIGGVQVFLAVGFTAPISDEDDIRAYAEGDSYSTLKAGWTVVCNDRAVVYCDRTELTGWGEAGVPKYHTQFIAISGIVEFWSDDASLLPTTTTKRGIDASSLLYLRVKNKMREGLKLFTDFTNKWKSKEISQVAKNRINIAESLSMSVLQGRVKARTIELRKIAGGGSQLKPKLPVPDSLRTTTKRISFNLENEDIQLVSRFLFGDDGIDPSEVVEKCFDIQRDKARQ